jgi:hypothetical protein
LARTGSLHGGAYRISGGPTRPGGLAVR